MKGDCGGVRVILGLLFERDNEVEGEPIVEGEKEVKREDGDDDDEGEYK